MGRWDRVLAVGTVIALPLWGQGVDSTHTPTQRPISPPVTTALGKRDMWHVGNTVTLIDVDSVLRTSPAKTITDVLEGRVPGLTVIRSSGVPGAPSTIYLRGEGDIAASNQPIVILDGIRLSANRSAPPPVNLANLTTGGLVSAPSALDQIDPHAIATIEVLHGPAATALYGSDAGAGVIVLTTKRGSGRTADGKNAIHVTATYGGGISSLPGSYPTNLFRFGTTVSGPSPNGICSPTARDCVVDSLVRFQALNDSRYSPFGNAGNSYGSITVAGGLSALAYSVTGSASGASGILTLPELEQDHFQQVHGYAAPDWMIAPDYYGTQSGTGTLSFPLPRNGSVTVTGALFNSTQQRSSLENAIPALLGVYLDPDSAQQNGFVPDYLERSTSHAFTSTAGATLQWPLASWLPLQGSFGVDHVTRNDKYWLPAGYTSDVDSLGFLQTGNGIGATTTGMLSTLLPQLSLGFSRLTAAIGVSAMRTANLTSLAVYDPLNGTLPLQLVESSRFELPAASTISGFVEPRLDLTSRLFVNAGVRWDQNHLAGLPNTVSAYPHVDASWIASDEPALHLKSVFSSLRFRLAYGYAGTQAGMSPVVQLTDPAASSVPAGFVNLQGWIFTHPERSQEFEGGIDAGVWRDRVSLSLTAYRKRSHDMVAAPPPIGTSPVIFLAQNTADVQNAGLEASLTLHLLQTSLMAWSVGMTASRNDNMVQGVNSSVIQSANLDFLGTRIVAGAPLFSRWARPVVNVADVNHDGIIESNEYQLADSAVSLGSEFPRNTVGLNTVMSFFNGRITAATTVEYEGGFSQANGAALYVSQSGTSFLGNSVNASSATLVQQAEAEAVPQTLIGVMQTVQTLRWSDLSVAYNVPLGFARRLHLGALSVAFQGTNLALHTNYHGIDPAVNALPTGYGVMDLGEVPLPRTFDLRVTVGT